MLTIQLDQLFLTILTICATIIGPIIAVKMQKHSDNANATRDKKISLFKTLMLTRASTLDYQHVQAINLIPIEFDKRIKAEEDIIDTWKLYFDHLNSDSKSENWLDKKRDLLIDLLQKMATYLEIKLNRSELTKEIYLPMAHTHFEDENIVMRSLMIKLLDGQNPLKIEINSMPIDIELQKRQEQLQEKWFEFFEQQSNKKVK